MRRGNGRWGKAVFTVALISVLIQFRSPISNKIHDVLMSHRYASRLRDAHSRKVDVLFIGDSLTEQWSKYPDIWSQFGPNAANLGYSGDRTNDLLARIGRGDFDGLSPRVEVLLIGTNDLPSSTPDQIVKRVGAIIAGLHDRSPETRILLLQIPPRRLFGAESGEVNRRLPAMASDRVSCLDVSAKIRNADGSPIAGKLIDGLHLSREAYRDIADSLLPSLCRLSG